MTNKTIYILIALLCLACLGIGIMAGYNLAPKPIIETRVEFKEVPIIKVDTLVNTYTKIRRDTALKFDTTLIEIVRVDTVTKYASQPFMAHFDTTTTNGRVRLDYLYPENMVNNLVVEPKQIKYFQAQTVYKERSIWIDILTHTGSAAVGFGLGYLYGVK